MSTDVSVVSMDTDNEDSEHNNGNIYFTKGAEFDLAESCPDIYRCPISKELMTKPVMLHDDGHTYNEPSLKQWLESNSRSPLTGVDLKHKTFTRNYALQSAIEQFQTSKQAQVEAHAQTPQKPSKDSPLKPDLYVYPKSVTSRSASSDMDLSAEASSDQEEEEKHVSSDPSSAVHKLTTFLCSLSLEAYVETFIAAGFVCMDDFVNITFNDLVAMNIPIIHARRLQSAIDRYKAHNSPRELTSSAAAGAASPSSAGQRPDFLPLTNSIIIQPGRIPKSQNSAPLNCNILLLGDAYVGKTSLRKRLELDDFVATQATQGVELTCLLSNFQGEDLQITIWDPAGQERYAPITKTFFRRAHAAAIIFSADEPSTWKHVEFWMDELEQNAPDDIEWMLICNKIDLLTDEDDNGDIELSEVMKRAIQISAQKRVPFFTTSAKNGESVKLAFQELVSQLLNNQAILDKMYRQRDGTLKSARARGGGQNESGHEDAEDEDAEDTPTPQRQKNGRKIGQMRKRLSWRARRHSSQAKDDGHQSINLNHAHARTRSQYRGSGCCR